MMFRVAIAFIALAANAFAQHGGAHTGSFGSRGSAGHAGSARLSGSSRAGSYVRSAPPVRGSALLDGSRVRGMGPPNYAGRSIRGYGNRHMTPRPAYGSMGTGP